MFIYIFLHSVLSNCLISFLTQLVFSLFFAEYCASFFEVGPFKIQLSRVRQSTLRPQDHTSASTPHCLLWLSHHRHAACSYFI